MSLMPNDNIRLRSDYPGDSRAEEIESLRKQLDFWISEEAKRQQETNSAVKEVSDYAASLEQQLANKAAEIERLRAAIPDKAKRDKECVTSEDWRMAALYYESQWSSCSYGYNKAVGELSKKLAASQAREQQLLEALERLDGWLRERYHVGLVPSERELLDQSQRKDTTALQAMIAKAGDMMRERCCMVVFSYPRATEIAIRALPAITLDDLK